MKKEILSSFVALACGLSATTEASTWVPVGSGGNVIFIPKPGLNKVDAPSFQYGSQTDIKLTGIGASTGVFYQYQQFKNGAWEAFSPWSCQSATDIKSNNDRFKLALDSGRYRFNFAVTMKGKGCEGNSYSGRTPYSSVAYQTNEFLLINNEALQCSDSQSNPVDCFKQNPKLSNETEKELESYDLHLNWPRIDGVDQYTLILEKDSVPYQFDVSASAYNDTSTHYLIEDKYFSETGSFTPYTGYGQYHFKVRYCFAGKCSFPIDNEKTKQTPATVDVLYPEFFWADSFNGTSIRLVVKADIRTPNFTILESFFAEGSGTGFGPMVDIGLTMPDAQTTTPYSVDSNGNLRMERIITPTKDGRYRYHVKPCTSKGCLRSHAQNNSPEPVINITENVPHGNIYTFVPGNNELKGWAKDSDSAYATVKLYVNDIEMYASTQTASQPIGVDGASTGFAYTNLQALLQRPENNVNLNQPFTLDVRVKDAPSNNYVSIGKIFVSNFYNQPPVATNDAIAGILGESMFINVLHNDSDPENNPLTPVNISKPEFGSIAVSSDNKLFYTNHTVPGDFKDSFTYQVRDSHGELSSEVATVTVYFTDFYANDDAVYVDWADTSSSVTQAPIVMGRAAQMPTISHLSANGQSEVTINVLSNDQNVDYGGTISVLLGDKSPSGGSLVFNNDNTITYKRVDSSIAEDCFNYYFTKGVEPSNMANVCVRSNPKPQNDFAGTEPGKAVDIYVLNNDKGLLFGNYDIVHKSTPANGSIEIFNSNNDLPDSISKSALTEKTAITQLDTSSQFHGNKFIRYTPNSGFTGTDTFQYSVKATKDTGTNKGLGDLPTTVRGATVSVIVGEKPAVPGNLAVSKINGNTLNVSWNGITWYGNHVKTFQLKRFSTTEEVNLATVKEDQWKEVANIDFNTTNFSDAGLDNGRHYYRVRACKDTHLCGQWSSVASGQLGPVYETIFVMTDVLGSPIAETDSSGKLVEGAHYKPFGSSIEGEKDDIGYGGHEFDTDLDLTYMKARYYDPVIGRFMAVDPVWFKNVHNFNRYAYANNNPFKYVDPDGKEALLQWHEVGAGLNHALLTLYPENPQNFNGPNAISQIGRITDENGRKFGTVGAGPGEEWDLIGGFNRENDVMRDNKLGSIRIRPLHGMSEDDLIRAIQRNTNNYIRNSAKNDLDYSFIPGASFGEDKNSNSFIAGLLESLGYDTETLDVPDAPGWDEPVPVEMFWDVE